MLAEQSAFRRYVKNHTKPIKVEAAEAVFVGEKREGWLEVVAPYTKNIPFVPAPTTHIRMETVDKIDDEMPDSMNIMGISHRLEFLHNAGGVGLLLHGFLLQEDVGAEPNLGLTVKGDFVPATVPAILVSRTLESLQQAERQDDVVFLPSNAEVMAFAGPRQ